MRYINSKGWVVQRGKASSRKRVTDKEQLKVWLAKRTTPISLETRIPREVTGRRFALRLIPISEDNQPFDEINTFEVLSKYGQVFKRARITLARTDLTEEQKSQSLLKFSSQALILGELLGRDLAGVKKDFSQEVGVDVVW